MIHVKVRNKNNGMVGSSDQFNTHGIGEIIIGFDDGADSQFVRDYDVQLKLGEWKDMNEAFRDRDIIEDNYATWFREPVNEEERVRGYYY